ncbi:MAG: SDR family NAD(P)-dependent oxidoreductase [Rhodospirillales bacterium]|nr:SDR family NAD(P)-dependent oxidoreductase [Rhodospirillales bacterium]
MAGLCAGRVAIVTGAGRGIGAEYAKLLAAHGASVVVNDLGGAMDGTGADETPAQGVVREIIAAGGKAVVNTDNVADWNGARRLVEQAIDTFGKLDVLVNNAGILRDRMLTNMTEAEWDGVINVHLKGTFAPSRHAAAHWRALSKEHDRPVDARIINTSSVSGIYGNPGQTNYGAAKMGIAAFTIIAARELKRYGVTVNAIAPIALTRLTEGLRALTEEEMERRHPRHVAPAVVWLASTQSADFTGRVVEAGGGILAIAEGWHRGPTAEPEENPEHLGPVMYGLLARARKNAGMNGQELD